MTLITLAGKATEQSEDLANYMGFTRYMVAFELEVDLKTFSHYVIEGFDELKQYGEIVLNSDGICYVVLDASRDYYDVRVTTISEDDEHVDEIEFYIDLSNVVIE
jgi:hypothetical protein